MAEKKKDAFIIRSFNDAGTNQAFEAGTIESIEEGSFLNYRAAGLVREPTAADRANVAKKPAA
ncbi:hypothetical protein [Rhizorhabdus histidinilytica]|uniref:hypothetical protein n=1 Tax=Rhizorhabdus histidinilytica TaxID=439228 RepID=UPI00321FFB26